MRRLLAIDVPDNVAEKHGLDANPWRLICSLCKINEVANSATATFIDLDAETLERAAIAAQRAGIWDPDGKQDEYEVLAEALNAAAAAMRREEERDV